MGNDYSKAKKVIYHGTPGNYELWTGEARNARWFDNIAEPWRRPGWFKIGRACQYRPDFYLPRLDLYIEVKNMDADYLLEDDLAIEKMQMFYENGYNLYVVDGSPVTDPGYAFKKFQESGKIFFSDKYIHADFKIAGERRTGFVMIGRGYDNKAILKHADYWSPQDYIEEAREAKNYDFENHSVDLRELFGGGAF